MLGNFVINKSTSKLRNSRHPLKSMDHDAIALGNSPERGIQTTFVSLQMDNCLMILVLIDHKL